MKKKRTLAGIRAGGTNWGAGNAAKVGIHHGLDNKAFANDSQEGNK
jgi:hypothetical protein